ncbi:unnamed protein product [Heterobilharzia americana]|nr:unnamed protein product [Heterobilharzia americana]
MDFVLIHGFIFQYLKNNSEFRLVRRWAYVKLDSLFIFPDHFNRSSCLKVFLKHSDVSVSYPHNDTPWITITEYSGAVHYLKPEVEQAFQTWLTVIYKASKNETDLVKHDQEYGLHRTSQQMMIPMGLQERRKLNQSSVTYSTAYPVDKNEATVSDTLSPSFQFVGNTHSNKTLEMNDIYKRNSAYTNARSLSRSSQFNFIPHEDKPPPRPPRNPHPLHTVKEHSTMRDDEIVETKPLTSVKHRYPVTGLAKRMSIAASDLLGKSRDDLILLLLQLNREKANLKRWHEYFTYQIDQIRLVKGGTREARSDIAAIQGELNDVIGQLELSEPLIKFLDNMIRMGDVYGGDDVLFASEYRRHLLPSHEIVPSNPSLEFARDIEEREVARVLNSSVRHVHRSESPLDENHFSRPITPLSPLNDLNTMNNSNSLSIIPKLDNMPEPEEIRLHRRRLEEELNNLENLCAPHQLIHNKLRDTQKAIRQNERNKSAEQSNKFHSKAPSASLLRRLHSEGIHHRQLKSANNSLRRKTLDGYDNDDLYDYIYKRPSTDFGHDPQSSFRRLRSNSRNNINHKEEFIDNKNLDGIKKFQSIPDDLNLLTRDSLYMQNKTKPLQDERHKPLNFSNPIDFVKKSSARSRTYSGQRISPPATTTTTTTRVSTINNLLRKSFELPSKYAVDSEMVGFIDRRMSRKPFREYSSNEIKNNNEWNHNSRNRRSFNATPTQDIQDDLQDYSKSLLSEQKRLYDENKNSSYDSNKLKPSNYDHSIRQKFDDLLEDIDFPTVQSQYNKDILYEDDILRMKNSRDRLEGDRVSQARYDTKLSRNRQPITVSEKIPSKTSSLSTYGQYLDTVYANISQNYPGSTLQRSELSSGNMKQLDNQSTNRSDYFPTHNSKRDTLISNCSSISEQNKIQPIRKHLLPQTNTSLSEYKSNLYDSYGQRYRDVDNPESTGSLESMFTSQEPYTLEERRVTTARPLSREDFIRTNSNNNNNQVNVITLRNKEDKINSLRNVLLRQSLTDSPVYNQNDDHIFNGNQATEKSAAVAERVRLITVKEQLAKEAAVTVAPYRKLPLM